jgi:O-antigen/teichoic acid export membrane protein
MPAFAEIQADKNKINTTILNVTAMIAFFGIPLCTYAALYGGDLLRLAYGSEYVEIATPFAIIFGTSVLQTVGVPIVTFYLAIGQPALHRSFTAIRAATMLVLIYPAIENFGLIGAATTGLIAMTLGYLVQVLWVRALISFDLRRYGVIFLQALGASGCVVASWLITHHIAPGQIWFNLIPGIIGCLVAYMLSLRIFLHLKSQCS